jgi:hypothetical protein
MIKKYLFLAFAIISISLVSCRQDNETIEIENENALKIKVDSEENQNFGKASDSLFNVINPNGSPNGNNWQGLDSISLSDDPNDPPKNGTHWKESDSTKSLDDTTDPPKNGTHWKGKN